MKNYGIVFLMSWLFVFQPLVASSQSSSDDSSAATSKDVASGGTGSSATTEVDATTKESTSEVDGSTNIITNSVNAAGSSTTKAASGASAAPISSSLRSLPTNSSPVSSTATSIANSQKATDTPSVVATQLDTLKTAVTPNITISKDVASSSIASSATVKADAGTKDATSSINIITNSVNAAGSSTTKAASGASSAPISSSLTSLPTNNSPVSSSATSIANSQKATDTSSAVATQSGTLKTAATSPIIAIPTAPTALTASTTLANEPSEEDDVSLTVDVTQQIDLDTMTIGVGGNWLQKRVYYEKAAELYEEIQDLVNQCEDTKTPFLNEVKSLENKIEDFYKQVSSDKGNVTAMLAAFTDMLSMQEERAGDLSVNERAVQQTILDEEEQVKKVGDSIEIMGSLDDKVDEIMQLVLTAIDSCREYESKAWDNFKEITQSLDDQKARTLYYEMENFSENIQQQLHYLNNTLSPFLQTTLGKQITDNISAVESVISDLKSKGVNLGTEIKKYSEDDIEIESQRQQYEIDAASQTAVEECKQKEAEERAQKEAEEQKLKKEAEESSWTYKFVTKIICPLKSAWDWLSSKLTVLKPFGEAISSGIFYLSTKCKQLFCIILSLLSNLKFW